MATDEAERPGAAERPQEPGAAAPGRGGRMSRQRKTAAVLRLLRGEDLETVSRSLGVTAAIYRHRPQCGSTQAMGLRPAFVRMYPLYDSFIQTARCDRPRLGRMISCLMARTGAPVDRLDPAAPGPLGRKVS